MSSVLIAGVGNVFFGDDAFGVEVARRLARLALPSGTRAIDFGIRGLHLAYELLDPVDLLVIVDAVPRGRAPGTLYVIDPALEGITALAQPDAHGMELPSVFAALRSLGGTLPPTRIVGCEPLDVQEGFGLSPPVAAALDTAVQLVLEVAAAGGGLQPAMEAKG